MNSGFWILAGFLIAAAVAILVVPVIMQQKHSGAKTGRMTIAVLVLAVPVFGVTMYLQFTTGWPRADVAEHASADQEAGSMDEMIVQLEDRLATNPNDLQGWIMLGRSWVFVEQYQNAVTAYARANELSQSRDPDVLIAYAESLVLADRQHMGGAVRGLLHQALSISPQHAKGLWLAGQVEWEEGNYAAAADFWERLMPLAPDDDVREVLSRQLAEARARSGTESLAASETPASVVADGVTLQVTVAPEISNRYAATTPVFIIARDTDVGPPLAVVRKQASELPMSINLTDQNVMVPGRKISDKDSLKLVARISLSGSPTAKPGDLYGEAVWARGQNARTAIHIDSTVP